MDHNEFITVSYTGTHGENVIETLDSNDVVLLIKRVKELEGQLAAAQWYADGYKEDKS